MPASIQVKSILNKKKQRDPWFLDDYTINAYSGCSFNCLYCYIGGSKYGTNMEDKLSIKSNALELLDKQLFNRSKKGQYGIIVMSSATDPYLQFEKEKQLTREMLKLILKYRFPLHLITKSDLVVRDFDLLQQINEIAILPLDLQQKMRKKVLVTFSFSTLDDAVGKMFEPGATPPSLRFATMRETLKAGFHSGVSLMPLLPYISDTTLNFDHMFNSFKSISIKYIMASSITLFGNDTADSKTLVLRAIEKYYPHLLLKYQKFFSANNSMGEYYTNALGLKINEMCKRFGIPQGILNSFKYQ